MSFRKIRQLNGALVLKSVVKTRFNPFRSFAVSCLNVTSNGSTFKCGENGTMVGSTPVSSAYQTHRSAEVSKPVSGRTYCSSAAPKTDSKTHMWSRYTEMKRLVQGKKRRLRQRLHYATFMFSISRMMLTPFG